jgi:hypothetical protein
VVHCTRVPLSRTKRDRARLGVDHFVEGFFQIVESVTIAEAEPSPRPYDAGERVATGGVSLCECERFVADRNRCS